MRGTCAALSVATALAACGDPLRGIERVSELPEPLPNAEVAALPEAEDDTTPILAGLFRRAPAARAPDPAIELAVREANGAGPPVDKTPPPPDEAAQTVEAEPASPPRRNVLGWLRRAVGPTDQQPSAEGGEPDATPPFNASEEITEPEVEVAALETGVVVTERETRGGLFGLGAAPLRQGPDARDVAVGTVLPFGEIARVCDAKTRNMGTIVGKAARKGRGYVLYDSAPDSEVPRTFYVTGFADNCARQFTASLALFGAPVLHEQLRYGLPARDFPYSATDEAYEKVKGKVCNVRRSKPCGSRISRLEKTTTFVSVYENFGENARWNDILLHDGQVLAAALKSP